MVKPHGAIWRKLTASGLEVPARDMIEALPIGVIVVDTARRILFHNPVARNILGRDLPRGTDLCELARGASATVASTQEPYSLDRMPIVVALHHGQTVSVDDMEIDRRGERIVLEMFGYPILGPAGDVCYAVAVFRDITERRRTERKLAEQRELLQEVNRELESFTYSVSHDLRAPLRAIDGFARILASEYEDRLDDEARRLLGVVRQNAQTMGRLIDDLLAFSRISRSDVQQRVVDMEGMVRGVVREHLSEEDRATEVVIESPIPPALGDPSMLRQVWINLIDNAFKFSSRNEQRRISVSATSRAEETVYSVADNGIGFDSRYAEKLYTVFQRLHAADEFEGTGVGLALVKRIVDKHRGRVWAESSPGEGAVFHFALPEERPS